MSKEVVDRKNARHGVVSSIAGFSLLRKMKGRPVQCEVEMACIRCLG